MSEIKVPALSSVQLPPSHWMRKLSVPLFVIGCVCLGALFALGKSDTHEMYFAYLPAFLFGLALCLGGLFFVLLHHATKSGWSVVIRRIAENLAGVLPFFVVLFIPVVMGMHDLYHWTHADAVAEDALLQSKQAFLNIPFFLIRAGFYFFVWVIFAVYYRKSSLRQDISGDQNITRQLQSKSYVGILLFALTSTFAAFDWIMSLDPHWYSTIFGVYFFAGCVVTIFAFMSLISVFLRLIPGMDHVITREHLHDMGKMEFAFVVFWTYIAFSQFFLIWYGNIPEETIWYARRLNEGWLPISQLIAIGHFAAPFLFLLSRTIKRNPVLLGIASLWMLFMEFIDLNWLVLPEHTSEGLHFGTLHILALCGVLGILFGVFFKFMAGNAIIPVKDPRLPESLALDNL